MRPAVAAVLFACLLLTLAATSSPRIVGDGSEYVHLAARLASGQMPGAGESRHFIFYSALAAPVVVLGRPIGLDAAAAFTILNGLLLLAAFYVAASRLHWTFCAIVFAGPILWWLDKPHTEPFTFALYAVAFALLASAPWWSLVAVGAAATQNPGNAALIGILAVAAVAGRVALLKDRRFWLGLAAGTVLAALHPAYYLARLGTPTRLASAGDVHRVTWQEYTAVLADPNIGLFPQVPVYGAALLGGVILLAWIAPRRLGSPAVVSAAASAAWLAFVAATATNVNHGGTPGLSRYATWFIPLAIPLFQEVDRVLARRVTWMAIPAVASAVLGIWAFYPARPEAADRPTRLASFLWARHPSLDNPLPEIFAERLRGLDENWLPVATPGCEKILLPGRGGRDSVWPMPCAPATPPARCQLPGATCYANRTKTGYAFVSPRVSTPQAFRLARSSTWPLSAEPFVADALSSLAWWNMSPRQAGDNDAVVQSSRHVGHVVVWQAENRFFAFAVDVRPGAELVALVTREMTGSFTVESGPIEGIRVRMRPGLGRQAIRLPSPQPWVMLVAEAR
ncbi:MAG: hypothetical protein R6V57_13215 [Vicinamibacterales bacterium]